MTSPLIPYEIGCTEGDELIVEDDAKLFVCPKCEKKFFAFVEIVHGDEDMMPEVELILCTDCEESFDPSNLYLLWLDWNNDHDVVH